MLKRFSRVLAASALLAGSLAGMASQRITPMPPAPTIPTTVAERTLDSKRYSE